MRITLSSTILVTTQLWPKAPFAGYHRGFLQVVTSEANPTLKLLLNQVRDMSNGKQPLRVQYLGFISNASRTRLPGNWAAKYFGLGFLARATPAAGLKAPICSLINSPNPRHQTLCSLLTIFLTIFIGRKHDAFPVYSAAPSSYY